MRRSQFAFPVSSLAGTTPGNILKLLKKYRVEPRYYLKLFLSFIVALIFEILRFIEHLFWGKRIRNFQSQAAPVFIVGFNRCGTTLLHNLLCQDPKAGYTTTLHTVFPHCVLSQKKWLSPVANFLVPEKRPYDNVPMNMAFPQEEEFALANLQAHSIYNFFVFPKDFLKILDEEYFLNGTGETETWKREYRQMVVKSLLNTGGERYISKNPQNIPRITTLNEMYPGSHFIFIYRDPYIVVESWFNFILAIFPGIQLQSVEKTFSRKEIAIYYAVAMKTYFETKEKPGCPEILEIRMEDFMKDKLRGLREIYSFCRIDGFDQVIPVFEAFLSQHQKPPHQTLTIHPDTIRFVNHYASEFVTRLGYNLR